MSSRLIDRAEALRAALSRSELTDEHRPILEGELYLVEKQLQAAAEKKSARDVSQIERALQRVSTVEIADGTYKFAHVVVQLKGSSSRFDFVRSHPYAKYHYMAIQDLIDYFSLELHMDEDDYEVPGGGRIHKDPDTKEIEVYGYSNQFGQTDNAYVAKLIRQDSRYSNWSVTSSNEGY